MHTTVCLQPGTVEGGKPTEVEKQMTIKACLNRITPDNFQQVLAGIIAVGYETVDTETCLVNQVQPQTRSPLFCLPPPSLDPDANTADVDILNPRVLDAPCRLSCLMLIQQVSVNALYHHAVCLQSSRPCFKFCATLAMQIRQEPRTSTFAFGVQLCGVAPD